jgi:hypothetical protein
MHTEQTSSPPSSGAELPLIAESLASQRPLSMFLDPGRRCSSF